MSRRKSEAPPPTRRYAAEGPVSMRKKARADAPPPTRRFKSETAGKSRAPATKTTVAFLGLGAMGKPMALRLAESGHALRVWNRTVGPDRWLMKAGATSAKTPGDCVLGADVIVTMLSDAEALASVLEGREGVLAALASDLRSRRRRADGAEGAENARRPRPVLVDMSTIGRRAALEAGRRVEEHGARFVDAPVSGSVGPAARGELVALVGGAVRSVERARPVLDVLCKKVIHAGPIGAGQTLKVVLNGLGAHHFVAFASMLALGERAGLARDVVLEAFTTGAFATPSYLGKRAKVLVRDWTPEFSLALTLKDCRLAAELQDEVGLALPVHRAIVAEVEAGIREGLGDLDLYGLEKHYAR